MAKTKESPTNESTERMQCAFPFLDIPEATPKPRNSRWLIVTERGLPLRYQQDLLDLHGDLIDYVKFSEFTGMLRRCSVEQLKAKISLYKAREFPTVPGGIAFEIAYLQKQVERYFDTVKELGFNGVEVSDDSMPELSREVRTGLIRRGISMGLDVFTEVGKKYGDAPFPIKEMIDCSRADLDAGACKVTVENSELFYYCRHDNPKPVQEIVAAVGLDNLVFEVDPNGWPEVALWLLNLFGPEINVENIDYERIVTFEGMRRGLSRIGRHQFVRSLQEQGDR